MAWSAASRLPHARQWRDPVTPWKDGSVSFGFWATNIGLLAMVTLSLLPVGLMQTGVGRTRLSVRPQPRVSADEHHRNIPVVARHRRHDICRGRAGAGDDLERRSLTDATDMQTYDRFYIDERLAGAAGHGHIEGSGGLYR